MSPSPRWPLLLGLVSMSSNPFLLLRRSSTVRPAQAAAVASAASAACKPPTAAPIPDLTALFLPDSACDQQVLSTGNRGSAATQRAAGRTFACQHQASIAG